MPGQGTELGSAHIEIRATQDQLKKDLDAAHGTVQESLGKLATIAAGAGLALAAAFAGATVAAFKLGETFDSAYDTIRASTGKTGEALEGLKDDFKAVVKDVPADFETASAVVAELNKRTGATGETLQGLSKNVLEFSRITGTDAVGNVALATRMFGDWSVASEDQSGALDKVFRASQATGIGVQELMGKVVQFGAPLRAMGFSMDESAAMLGKWEKEGVNTELVLGSMRIAMGKFADAGIPAREGLDQTVAKINELGPSAEATSLAMDVFGARAGPDMAAAILEGRFALGDLIDQVSNGSETIQSAAEDTADGAERMKLAMNRVALAFEPVGNAVFGLQAMLIEKLAPAVEQAAAAAGPMIAAFANGIGPALDQVFAVVGPVADAVGQALLPALQAAAGFMGDNLQATLAGVSAALAALGVAFIAIQGPAIATAAATAAAMAPVVVAIVAVGVAVAALKYAWDNDLGGIQEKAAAVWDFLETNVLAPLGAELARFGAEVLPELLKAWETVTRGLQANWEMLWSYLGPAIELLAKVIADNHETIERVVTAAWDTITMGVRIAWDLLSGIILAGLKLLQGDWQGAWDVMRDHLASAWDRIRGLVDEALPLIQEAISNAWAAIQRAAEAKWNEIRETIATFWRGVQILAAAAVALLAETLAGAWENLKATAANAWNRLPEIIGAAWEAVKTATANAVANLSTAFANAGPALMELLRKGLADRADSVLAPIRKMAADVAALLPHSWADEGPLSEPTDWNDVIVANLPSRIDFARASVKQMATDVGETMGGFKSEMQTDADILALILSATADSFTTTSEAVTIAVGSMASSVQAAAATAGTALSNLSPILDKATLHAISTATSLAGWASSGKDGMGFPLFNAGDVLPSGFRTDTGDNVINDRGEVRVWRGGELIHKERTDAGGGPGSYGWDWGNDPKQNPAIAQMAKQLGVTLPGVASVAQQAAALLNAGTMANLGQYGTYSGGAGGPVAQVTLNVDSVPFARVLAPIIGPELDRLDIVRTDVPL